MPKCRGGTSRRFAVRVQPFRRRLRFGRGRSRSPAACLSDRYPGLARRLAAPGATNERPAGAGPGDARASTFVALRPHERRKTKGVRDLSLSRERAGRNGSKRRRLPKAMTSPEWGDRFVAQGAASLRASPGCRAVPNAAGERDVPRTWAESTAEWLDSASVASVCGGPSGGLFSFAVLGVFPHPAVSLCFCISAL